MVTVASHSTVKVVGANGQISLGKIRQLTWAQVYRDNGLKWEKIVSVRPA